MTKPRSQRYEATISEGTIEWLAEGVEEWIEKVFDDGEALAMHARDHSHSAADANYAPNDDDVTAALHLRNLSIETIT